MTKRVFRNRYSEIDPCGIVFSTPSLTEQSAYDDVNIHSIVSRGMNALPPNTLKPMYNVNLSQIGDYQSVLQRSADLKNSYEDLPIEVRKKFNSPEEFLEFCENKEKNYEEGLKLGIFTEKGEPSVFEKSIEKIANFYEKSTQEVITGEKTPDNNSGMSAN